MTRGGLYQGFSLFLGLALLAITACSAGGPTAAPAPADTATPPPAATPAGLAPTSTPTPAGPEPLPAASATAFPVAAVQATPGSSARPGDRWVELFQQTPFPFTTPLPPATTTPIDGVYTKIETRGEPIPCRRCPDFKPENGIWKLSLDKGIFRIFYQEKGWRSIASYTAEGDRFTVFNDPNCLDTVGTYTWRSEEGQLLFQVVEDSCHVGRRALNLTGPAWRSCRPDNQEAAVTDHWSKPPGC